MVKLTKKQLAKRTQQAGKKTVQKGSNSNPRHREEFNRLLSDAVLGVRASGRT